MSQTVEGLRGPNDRPIPVRWQYPTSEAIELMGVSKSTLQRMIHDGSIVGVRADDGKIRHVEGQSMIAYIRERQTSPDPEAGQ